MRSLILSDETLTLARTPAFKRLLREIEPQFAHMQRLVIEAVTKGEPYDAVRFTAGRLSGAEYLLGVLKHVEKEANAGKTP